MKEIKQYIGIVDAYRKNGMVFCDPKERLYQRPTKGRYQIAAKSERQAKELLREVIGFGSITIREDENPPCILPYKAVKKVQRTYKKDENKFSYEIKEPHHATDCMKEKEDDNLEK